MQLEFLLSLINKGSNVSIKKIYIPSQVNCHSSIGYLGLYFSWHCRISVAESIIFNYSKVN